MLLSPPGLLQSVGRSADVLRSIDMSVKDTGHKEQRRHQGNTVADPSESVDASHDGLVSIGGLCMC